MRGARAAGAMQQHVALAVRHGRAEREERQKQAKAAPRQQARAGRGNGLNHPGKQQRGHQRHGERRWSRNRRHRDSCKNCGFHESFAWVANARRSSVADQCDFSTTQQFAHHVIAGIELGVFVNNDVFLARNAEVLQQHSRAASVFAAHHIGCL